MFPERIACLSAESADICERLGAADRVIAVSAFAPHSMREGRKVIGGFSTSRPEELIALAPDLVITFSDVQADLSAALIRAHCTVLAANQRSLRQIAEAILLIGRAIGCPEKAGALAADFERRLEALRFSGEPVPRVYFEEWDDPLISGIGWVSEAIALTGGKDIFFRPGAHASSERHVDSAAVRAADPQIILASWCGKPVDPARIRSRPGWETVEAVRTGEIHAIDSSDILQPGPRVLAGIEKIGAIIRRWRERKV